MKIPFANLILLFPSLLLSTATQANTLDSGSTPLPISATQQTLLKKTPLKQAELSSQLNALSTSLYWRKLIHYHSATLTDWKSEVDDDRFFFASDGKTNPLNELNATIAAFNGIDNSTGEKLTPAETINARCLFPARYTWLQEQLDADWPALSCPELELWEETIDPEAITLVFPTAFMGNPSSMFGHTLLRIDAKDQTRDKDLVAFSVNFAADPDPSDGAVTYAMKGLIGQYPGSFSLMPYYKKVREYNDIESRDIWEYKLNFNPQEVRHILLHLWELQSATFDYYFIDENCSYQLLSLLQLANNDLNLTDDFPMQAIPSDTVAALRDNNLLQEPNYRPAFGTRLYHYSTEMTDEQLAATQVIMQGGTLDKSLYSDKEMVAILEMAYEWLNYNYYDDRLDREEIAPRLTNILRERSKYRIASPFSKPVKPSASPDEGHSSSKLSLGLNSYNKSPESMSFGYRLAYHDLLDDPAGFIPGAQISFLDVEGSVDKDGKTQLEKLYLIDSMSLPPDNRIFDPWSWNIRAGYDRQPGYSGSSRNTDPSDKKREGRWFTQGGYGKSIGDPTGLQAYMLAELEVNGGDIDRDFSVGAGTETGLLWQVNDDHKLALTGKIFWLANARADYHSDVNLDWNWSLARNWALRSQLQYQQWHSDETSAKVNLNYYF